MTTAEIRERLSEENPEAILLDGYDEALLGLGQRGPGQVLAVYSVKRIKEALCRDMDEEEADEFFSFNIAGAYCGEHTPILLYDDEE